MSCAPKGRCPSSFEPSKKGNLRACSGRTEQTRNMFCQEPEGIPPLSGTDLSCSPQCRHIKTKRVVGTLPLPLCHTPHGVSGCDPKPDLIPHTRVTSPLVRWEDCCQGVRKWTSLKLHKVRKSETTDRSVIIMTRVTGQGVKERRNTARKANTKQKKKCNQKKSQQINSMFCAAFTRPEIPVLLLAFMQVLFSLDCDSAISYQSQRKALAQNRVPHIFLCSPPGDS